MYYELKSQVCEANAELKHRGLIIGTWGNASAIDRAAGVVAIKPSGVSYEALRPDDVVVLDLDAKVVDGSLNPSSDTPTHLELYRSFEGIGGICHAHAIHSTMWAQAGRELPCLGTTHADYFYGPVPITRPMTREQIQSDYELNTGKVIVERFADLDPLHMPAVLVANHGPFTWGDSAMAAVEAMTVLEGVARMAYGALMINNGQGPISQELLDKHYLRKHGKHAYYGQKKGSSD